MPPAVAAFVHPPNPLSAIDLADWQNVFGYIDFIDIGPAVSRVVPEPPTVVLTLFGLLYGVSCHRNRKR